MVLIRKCNENGLEITRRFFSDEVMSYDLIGLNDLWGIFLEMNWNCSISVMKPTLFWNLVSWERKFVCGNRLWYPVSTSASTFASLKI